MNFKDIKIIIPTCDKYIYAVEGLMYTVNKFWEEKNDFIILGFEEPEYELYDNWKFVSLGKDPGAENWSNPLIEWFNTFEDEFFINMIDDTLMTRKADLDKIKLVLDYMIQNKSVKKCFLHGSLNVDWSGREPLGDISYQPVWELGNMFVDINQTANYRSSIQSSLWDTNYFKQTLKPNQSPWEYELQHIMNDGARILTTLTDSPTMYSHIRSKITDEPMPKWFVSMFEDSALPEEDVLQVMKIFKMI